MFSRYTILVELLSESAQNVFFYSHFHKYILTENEALNEYP